MAKQRRMAQLCMYITCTKYSTQHTTLTSPYCRIRAAYGSSRCCCAKLILTKGANRRPCQPVVCKLFIVHVQYLYFLLHMYDMLTLTTRHATCRCMPSANVQNSKHTDTDTDMDTLLIIHTEYHVSYVLYVRIQCVTYIYEYSVVN